MQKPIKWIIISEDQKIAAWDQAFEALQLLRQV